MCLLAGSSKMLGAFCVDLKEELSILNGLKNTKRIEIVKLKKKLSEFIEFHCEVKELRNIYFL